MWFDKTTHDLQMDSIPYIPQDQKVVVEAMSEISTVASASAVAATGPIFFITANPAILFVLINLL